MYKGFYMILYDFIKGFYTFYRETSICKSREIYDDDDELDDFFSYFHN